MTLRGTDVIAIAVLVTAAAAICYMLLLWRVRILIATRLMNIADQIGRLDEAIRAMETRLAERQPVSSAQSQQGPDSRTEIEGKAPTEEFAEIAPETQAAIAAAAVATLGPNAVVQSIKAAASPWTQQGRVLVQGGHNLRVRR